MAKRVRISDDDGSTWFTLPGNSASISNEAGEIEDTIFGQNFGSTQTGIIDWSIDANGLYKGFAGYVAKILKPGSSTAFTGEAMSQVGSSLTYAITDATKNVWDRATAATIKDDGSDVDAADIESIDYLFGRVTFVSGYTVSGAITVDGSYLPMESLGCTNSYTLTQQAQANDNTCMETAQSNNGHRTHEYGLRTVSIDLEGIYKAANAFQAALVARSEIVIEINPDGNSKSIARGFFKPINTGQSGDVGDIEQETITYNLSVPDDETIPYPFHWIQADDTTLNTAIIKCLDAWEAGTLLKIAYLPDGSTGVQGDCVVTDLTLTGGLEAMNEFAVNVMGSDELASYPS